MNREADDWHRFDGVGDGARRDECGIGRRVLSDYGDGAIIAVVLWAGRQRHA